MQTHLFDTIMHSDTSFFWQHMRHFDVKNRFDNLGRLWLPKLFARLFAWSGCLQTVSCKLMILCRDIYALLHVDSRIRMQT